MLLLSHADMISDLFPECLAHPMMLCVAQLRESCISSGPVVKVPCHIVSATVAVALIVGDAMAATGRLSRLLQVPSHLCNAGRIT